jgi:chloride channel protein, CIC family
MIEMQADPNSIPSTLQHPTALRFWVALAGIGVSAGLAAGLLTKLLEAVQSFAWQGSATNILRSAQNVSAGRCVLILCIAGIVTGTGQILLRRLSAANGIDTTAAIWFYAG